jgi:translation initiation factor eIF-2B subunit gamma
LSSSCLDQILTEDEIHQFVADTSIGDFTRVEEKSTIKKSTIGKHCIIGKMVKIVGCVLLDHCVICDGCVILNLLPDTDISYSRAKLDGCILGNSTTVGSKAELIRCVTQAGYEVKDNGEPIIPLPYFNSTSERS